MSSIRTVDPTFAFMTVDHDGKIRMDCSSPYAMAGLLQLKDRYRVAFANDTDADRHGIVTPSAGLLNPNHYLAVAIRYLLTHRPNWSRTAAVGKTLVSSGLIDRVVARLERPLREVPVGFKWFAPGPARGLDLLRRRGERRRQLPAPRRHRLDHRQGRAHHGSARGGDHRAAPAKTQASTTASSPRSSGRPGTPASMRRRRRRRRRASRTCRRESVRATTLAGEPITSKLTRAPGNDAPIGGLKIVAASGWFAARPSGTESLYKIYAESFRSEHHLETIVEEAQRIVGDALKSV